ncbi:hypothetical protein PFISCL1PPCAC_15934, partial [Pristionchus fissidentatus]
SLRRSLLSLPMGSFRFLLFVVPFLLYRTVAEDTQIFHDEDRDGVVAGHLIFCGIFLFSFIGGGLAVFFLFRRHRSVSKKNKEERRPLKTKLAELKLATKGHVPATPSIQTVRPSFSPDAPKESKSTSTGSTAPNDKNSIN